MPRKSIPISVRISAEEADFLAGLRIQDAATPSEKLRALIAAARDQHDASELGASALVEPLRVAVQGGELVSDGFSAPLHALIDFLPDLHGFLEQALHSVEAGGDGDLSSVSDDLRDFSSDELADLERGVNKRIFRLVESLIQATVTPRCHCYAPAQLREHVGQLAELLRRLSVLSSIADAGTDLPPSDPINPAESTHAPDPSQ